MNKKVINFMDSVHNQNYNALSPEEKRKFNTLAKRLLRLGGKKVTCPRGGEEDYRQLMDRGRLWDTSDKIALFGENSQCHRNSVCCWEANKDIVFIVTGYALYEDRWVQHSWCVTRKEHDIVETCKPHFSATTMYYGYKLMQKEMDKFAYFNN